MTYNRRLAGIFEQRAPACKPRRAERPLRIPRRFLRPASRALAVLAAAPLLIALRLGETSGSTVEWPLPDFPEPSGIAWHPLRNSLFLVGDEGDVGELSVDGRLLRKQHVGGDLEGVTVDPSSGLLYIVREGHEIIVEMNPDDFSISRRFTIDRSWKNDPNFLKRGGDGVEGLTFVPDAGDPEGGRFWAVNQYDPPVLVELDVPLRTSRAKYGDARIRRVVPVDSAPLSEVTWDAGSRRFLVLSALWKRVSVLDADGNYERNVHIPGFMTEGLALLPDGRFAIAQDSGGVLVWKPDGNPFRGDAPAGPPAPSARPAPMPPRASK